jgi:large subunit ribosomal protein L31
MKKEGHPKYYKDAKISCVCGSVFHSGATQPELKVDICNVCHPFYTGKQKMLDVEGRVERFAKRYAKMDATKAGVNTPGKSIPQNDK